MPDRCEHAGLWMGAPFWCCPVGGSCADYAGTYRPRFYVTLPWSLSQLAGYITPYRPTLTLPPEGFGWQDRQDLYGSGFQAGGHWQLIPTEEGIEATCTVTAIVLFASINCTDIDGRAEIGVLSRVLIEGILPYEPSNPNWGHRMKKEARCTNYYSEPGGTLIRAVPQGWIEGPDMGLTLLW